MKILFCLLLVMVVPEVQAQSAGIPAISIDGGNGDGQTYTVTLEILALMTMLTLLRVPDLHSLRDHRPGRCQRVDVDGYDDVVADDYFLALQADVIRAG